MFEGKRTALIGMTFEAGLFVRKGLAYKSRARRHAPRWRECAMRIMAIRAAHKPFVHAMFEGHGELGSYIGMAAIAQIRLALGEQKLGRRGLMNGVAVSTNNIVRSVRRPPYVGSRQRSRVATQASIKSLLGGHL